VALVDFFTYLRLFQNFSFGTATLDLREKAGFRPLFPGACGKTIGFWNRLTYAKNPDYPASANLRFECGLSGIKIHFREFLYDLCAKRNKYSRKVALNTLKPVDKTFKNYMILFEFL
jgi:hypothetical protein